MGASQAPGRRLLLTDGGRSGRAAFLEASSASELRGEGDEDGGRVRPRLGRFLGAAVGEDVPTFWGVV